jgi:hypothetical protein
LNRRDMPDQIEVREHIEQMWPRARAGMKATRSARSSAGPRSIAPTSKKSGGMALAERAHDRQHSALVTNR